MSVPAPPEKNGVARRGWLFMTLVSLIPAVYAAAFLGLAWTRSEQGHRGGVYPSEIEGLAIHSEPADPLADAKIRGREVYQHYCQICHGKEGKGDGFNSYNLKPPPRDLTAVEFWQQTTPERVDYAVARGGPAVGKSVLMPAWGNTLTKGQLQDVITFIRTFAEKP